MSIANVLLVDDEVSFVETFSERLVMRDLEISRAFSGEEALQVLDTKNDIEVVILDVKCPGWVESKPWRRSRKQIRW